MFLAWRPPKSRRRESDAAAANTSDPAAASMIGVPFERHDVVRTAIVGTGLRKSVLHEWLDVPNVRIVVG